MKVKRKISARIFVFSHDAQHVQIEAKNRKDLVQQVKNLTNDPQATQLAKLAWTDEHSDLSVGVFRVACIGQHVTETWGKPPTQATTATTHKLQKPIQPPTQTNQQSDLPPPVMLHKFGV